MFSSSIHPEPPGTHILADVLSGLHADPGQVQASTTNQTIVTQFKPMIVR